MPDTREEALMAAHDAEAERLGVEILNYGWGQHDFGIASKTTAGVLSTEMDAEGHITHQLAPRR